MDRTDTALECFDKGFVCSQAVLSAFADQYGLDRDKALKLATAFGGGVACTAQMCGAVSGALMVIGLVHGRTDVEDKGAKEKTYQQSLELIGKLENRFGSIVCEKILGVNISTEEGMNQATETKLFETTCRDCIKYTVEILEQIL